jgi:hypothetical protein
VAEAAAARAAETAAVQAATEVRAGRIAAGPRKVKALAVVRTTRALLSGREGMTRETGHRDGRWAEIHSVRPGVQGRILPARLVPVRGGAPSGMPAALSVSAVNVMRVRV